MLRIRTTITNTNDRKEQLRRASRVRQDVIEHLEVRLDPEYPLDGVHRDDQHRAYFELDAESLDAIKTVLQEHGHGDYTEVTVPTTPNGGACIYCGNVSGPLLPPICANCGFRDISPCPTCRAEVSRESYQRIAGSLFACPNPKGIAPHNVRLMFQEPMFNSDGTYREPFVVVYPAREG